MIRAPLRSRLQNQSRLRKTTSGLCAKVEAHNANLRLANLRLDVNPDPVARLPAGL